MKLRIATGPVSATLLMALATSHASAQSLYQPYYYTVREQYQTMTNARPPQPSTDEPSRLSYAPDDRLTPRTNQRLAQGDVQPPQVPPMAPPPVNTLPVKSISGIDFGIQGSHYEYREPSVGVNENGGKFGMTASGTAAFGDDFLYFGTLDFRYALGPENYSGSGTKKDNSNNLWEIRGLVGRDFTWNETYDLSPYLGFGYRQLNDDIRGLTSTNAAGYRRESEYYYLPIGIKPRLRIDANSRLAGMLEFDQLIHGTQTSRLSDTGLGYSDITNSQSGGYGFRGELMYEGGNWSVGPFFNYWNINGSNLQSGTIKSPAICGGPATCSARFLEPQNSTTEYGVQLKYRFWTY